MTEGIVRPFTFPDVMPPKVVPSSSVDVQKNTSLTLGKNGSSGKIVVLSYHLSSKGYMDQQHNETKS
jgi:hypothetical protein